MKNYFRKFWVNNPKVRKVAGIVLIIIGLLSIVTPFTPVGFLLLLGLEILGLRVLVGDKLKSWFKKELPK
ncbi:MAG: hypothetical protein Q8Q92_01235 [bacterium]|nr:hypothetical protein [bacterium]